MMCFITKIQEKQGPQSSAFFNECLLGFFHSKIVFSLRIPASFVPHFRIFQVSISSSQRFSHGANILVNSNLYFLQYHTATFEKNGCKCGHLATLVVILEFFQYLSVARCPVFSPFLEEMCPFSVLTTGNTEQLTSCLLHQCIVASTFVLQSSFL